MARDAHRIDVEVHAGQTVLVPAGWFHHVNYPVANFTFSAQLM